MTCRPTLAPARTQDPRRLPARELLNVLQPGDFVFISVINPLYRHVALATDSRATHVGLAFLDEGRGWMIAESTFPFAKYTPLSAFLARSHGGWVAVRRLRGGFGTERLGKLRAACDRRMGVRYDLGFRYDSTRLFCSKLAYDAYREATGIEVGALETFADLLHKDPDQSLRFWRLWFFGRIPWSRRTVTPASQLHSPQLTAVYSHNNENKTPQSGR